MEKSTKRAGRPPGTTAELMEKRREAEGKDRFGLPLETPPRASSAPRLRPQHQDEVRAKIQASHIVRRLHECGDGLIDLTPAQIKAYEILLSKSLPTLAATELTSVNANDRMTEREIMDRIGELVAGNPGLLALLQRRAPATLEGEAVPSPHEPLCTVCHGEGLPGGCVGCGTVAEKG